MVIRLAFVLLLFFGLSYPAFGKEGGSQLSIGLGEALTPQQFRLTIKDVDFAISASAGITLGQRFWSDQHYIGFGIGIGEGYGFYGLIGHEFLLSEQIALSFEFSGYGSFGGQAKSKGYIVGGIEW